jgi:predicted esterase
LEIEYTYNFQLQTIYSINIICTIHTFSLKGRSMLKRISVIAAVIVFVFSFSVYAKSQKVNRVAKGQVQKFNLPKSKTYYIRYIPNSYDPKKPAPELFIAHGMGARPEHYVNLFKEVSEKYSIVLVLAKSKGQTWDPRTIRDIVSESTMHTEKVCNIDSKQFFMGGHSAGSMVAYILAYCTRNPVKGTFLIAPPPFPAAVQNNSTKPPALVYYGEADPFYAQAKDRNMKFLNDARVKNALITRPGKGHGELPNDVILEAFDYLINGKEPKKPGSAGDSENQKITPGAIQTFTEGGVFVPKKIARGNPTVVIMEMPGRGTMLFNFMSAAFTKEGVICVVPQPVMKNRQLDSKLTLEKTDALLKLLEKDKKTKPGKMFVMSFSAAGPLGYQFALQNPGKFDGLIIAASLPPDNKLVTSYKGKKGFPVFLVHSQADRAFGPDRGKSAEKTLKTAGFKPKLHILKRATHLEVVQKHADVFLKWIKTI